MISLDQGLLGLKETGDVIERHSIYGRAVEELQIIVFAPVEGFHRVAENVVARSTAAESRMGHLLRGVRIAAGLFRERTYDLVVTQDPMITGALGLILKYRFGARLLVHMHGDFLGREGWYKRGLRRRALLQLSRIVLRRADAVRVMSEDQKRSLEGIGVSGSRVRVIATPVDVSRFAAPGADGFTIARPFLKRWPRTILMVGRKDPVKDYDTLFKAISLVFARRSDVGLWLVGNYTEYDDIPLPRDRVRLTPRVDGQTMPLVYRSADVVVLSSRSESFGKVLVEANASGKPVVATATAGAREIVMHGYNGYLVEVGDYEGLSCYLLRILDQPETAERLGDNGREYVNKRFAANTSKITDFWHDIIGEAGQ
ncbi:MAG: glycosyltransferase family 4 protein [Gammaproteobacteria bacterium]|nr:glycosyltransferase family 4 protein [Gammaproteobacteria bacterium]